jgi:hypothetical protein
MSHYAAYIWPCYILAFCLLGVQGILAFIEWKMTWKKALKLYKDRRA